MNKLELKRIDNLYKKSVTNFLSFKTEELITQFNRTNIDIVTYLFDIYLSEQLVLANREFAEQLFLEKKNKDFQKTYNYLAENLPFILNRNLFQTLCLFKSKYIDSDDYRNKIIYLLDLSREQIRKESTIPQHIDEDTFVLFFQQFKYSELYLNTDNNVDIQNTMKDILLGKSCDYKEFQPNNFLLDPLILDNVLKLMESNLLEDIRDLNYLYIQQSYPKPFLIRSLKKAIKNLKEDNNLEKLVIKYYQWLQLNRDIKGQYVRYLNMANYIIYMFFNQFILTESNRAEKHFYTVIREYIRTKLEPFEEQYDFEHVLSFIEERGCLDSWSMEYFKEHNNVCLDRLNKTIQIYIDTYLKSKDFDRSLITEALGLSAEDLKRCERVDTLLKKYNLENELYPINYELIPLVNVFRVLTDTGNSIEFNPRWLKITIGNNNPTSIYHSQFNKSALSSYLQAIKPDLLPFDNENLKDAIHDIIIQGYDLRRKID